MKSTMTHYSTGNQSSTQDISCCY